MALGSMRLLLLATLLMGACTAEPQPTPAQQLTGAQFASAGGCGDAFIYATNAENTLAIVIQWPGAATSARLEDGFEATAELPASEVEVRLQSGHFLSEGFCTDIVMPDRPVLVGETAAVSGSVSISVTPEPVDPIFPLSRASIVLTGVAFEFEGASGPERWILDQLELRDVQIGWLAG